MARYIGLNELLGAVRMAGEVDPDAAVLLKLRRGALTAYAERFSLDKTASTWAGSARETGIDVRTNEPIPTKFWIAPDGDCDPAWSNSAARSVWRETDTDNWAVITYSAMASAVYVDHDAALALWPPLVRDSGAKPVGRPRTHDWEGALLELFRVEFAEGTKSRTQANLVEHLMQWFDSNGGQQPADSEVKRRVRRFETIRDAV